MNRRTIAALTTSILIGSVAAVSISGNAYAAPKSEPAAVIRLPLPPGATGGDNLAPHSGPLYAGLSHYPDGTQHPTVWIRTGFRKFIPIDIGLMDGFTAGKAMGTNDRGEVAIYEYVPMSPIETAFVWHLGRMFQLPDLSGGHSEATFGITADGRPYGYVDTADTSLPAVWTSWTKPPTTLQLPPGFTGGIAYDANAAGEFVGTVANADMSMVRAVIWRVDGSVRVLRPAPANPDSEAWGVSDRHKIVGEHIWQADSPPHATVWGPGEYGHDLGTLPGDAFSSLFGESSNGRSAGISTSGDFTHVRAVYWSGTGPLETLPPYGDPANSSVAHTADATGEVVGKTVIGFNTTAEIDIPTLWTDVPDQAFVPAATTAAARTAPAAPSVPARNSNRFAARIGWTG